MAAQKTCPKILNAAANGHSDPHVSLLQHLTINTFKVSYRV